MKKKLCLLVAALSTLATCIGVSAARPDTASAWTKGHFYLRYGTARVWAVWDKIPSTGKVPSGGTKLYGLYSGTYGACGTYTGGDPGSPFYFSNDTGYVQQFLTSQGVACKSNTAPPASMKS